MIYDKSTCTNYLRAYYEDKKDIFIKKRKPGKTHTNTSTLSKFLCMACKIISDELGN